MPELCRICHSRRPKRQCPGIQGEICALCCGDQREVNIACPLDCEHLREARLHEKGTELDRDRLPNKDIRISQEFINEHQELALFCMFTLADAALRTPGAVDADVLKVVEALIKTYRTRESGLLYETKTEDRVAARVQDHFERSMQNRQTERAAAGQEPDGNPAVLGCLAFIERSFLTQQNGRPRGRAYIDFLRLRLKIPLSQEDAGLLAS